MTDRDAFSAPESVRPTPTHAPTPGAANVAGGEWAPVTWAEAVAVSRQALLDAEAKRTALAERDGLDGIEERDHVAGGVTVPDEMIEAFIRGAMAEYGPNSQDAEVRAMRTKPGAWDNARRGLAAALEHYLRERVEAVSVPDDGAAPWVHDQAAARIAARALREMADTVHASEAEQEQLYVDRAGLGDCNLNRETALRCRIFRDVRRLIDERADELERGRRPVSIWMRTLDGAVAHLLRDERSTVATCSVMPPQQHYEWSVERLDRYHQRGEGRWWPAPDDMRRCVNCARVERGGDRG